jgi:hypothetical protein
MPYPSPVMPKESQVLFTAIRGVPCTRNNHRLTAIQLGQNMNIVKAAWTGIQAKLLITAAFLLALSPTIDCAHDRGWRDHFGHEPYPRQRAAGRANGALPAGTFACRLIEECCIQVRTTARWRQRVKCRVRRSDARTAVR